MTKKRKDQSDIDRKNKEIYSLIMDMGVALADLNYQWPNKLRRNFEKVTSFLSLRNRIFPIIRRLICRF